MNHSAKDSPNIIYQDNHIIVAVKEKGILTQPSPQKQESLEFFLKEHLKKIENKKTIFLHAVHRLDKDVSGLVLFAKSSKALQRLNLQMKEQNFEKIYQAEVIGIVDHPYGILEDYLVHCSHRAKVVPSSHKQGKKCTLEYQVVKKKKSTTILEIKIITGRYHQIRCQLSHHGHPILGDIKYGAPNGQKKGIQLHQKKLSFIHPTLKKLLSFTSPVL